MLTGNYIELHSYNFDIFDVPSIPTPTTPIKKKVAELA